MRILSILAILAAALWSGYWVIGSRSVTHAMTAWLDARAAEGRQVGYTDLRTRGFPNRFDTTITDPVLGDAASGFAWSAPFLQIFRLSYRPNHFILALSNEQTIAFHGQRVAVSTEKARASVVFRPATDLQPERANGVIDEIEIRSTAGWSANAARILLAARTSDQQRHAYEFGFEADGLRLPKTVSAARAEVGISGSPIDRIKVDATVGFDAAWDRTATRGRWPAATGVNLHLLQVNWGKLELRAEGALTVDARGRINGTLEITARNWRDILRTVQFAGWVPEGLITQLESRLETLAVQSASMREIEFSMAFSSGAVTIGSLALGHVPALSQR